MSTDKFLRRVFVIIMGAASFSAVLGCLFLAYAFYKAIQQHGM